MTRNQWSAGGGEALQEAYGRSGNQKAADQSSEKCRAFSKGWTDGMYKAGEDLGKNRESSEQTGGSLWNTQFW